MRGLAAGALVAPALALAAGAVAPSPSTARRPQRCHRRPPSHASLPRWATQRRMTVLVDSVLLGGAPALRRAMPCWGISVRGRPALMIRIAERELRAGRRVAPLVVVGLGYNSLWERRRRHHRRWAARFDREATWLLRTLHRRGAAEIVWVTLREPRPWTVPPRARSELGLYSWYFGYVNERLRRLDRRRGDLVLAPWRGVSRRTGLTYDSIHLNPRGARVMARTIRNTIRNEATRQARRRRR